MKLRAAAIALIAVTLGLKLHGNFAVPADDVHPALIKAVSQFQQAGFTARADLVGRGWLRAERRGCNISIRVLDPHGTNNTAYVEQMRPLGRLRYGWAGGWHDGLPRFGPLFHYYIKREISRQGIQTDRQAVWIMAMGRGCTQEPDPAFTRIPVPFGEPVMNQPKS